MSEIVQVIIGLDGESDQRFIDTDCSFWHEGDDSFKVDVPRHLVDELQRARAVARNAADAIANHVGFDHLTGRLPLCDEYDGQRMEWRGVDHWDDCWHCGWPRDEHVEAQHIGRTDGAT